MRKIPIVQKSLMVLSYLLVVAQAPTALAGDICELPSPAGDYYLDTYTYKYAVAGNESSALNLDLYTPTDVSKPPLVVLIHGGAWKNGSRSQGPIVSEAEVLVGMGYAVASIDYSLIQGVGPVPTDGNYFPQQTKDVLCAVKWLRAQSRYLNYDQTNIAVFGHSAGGHLASMVGTIGGHQKLFDQQNGVDLQCDQRNYSAKVKAVVAYYPVTYFGDLKNVATGVSAPRSSEPSNSLKTYKSAFNLVKSFLGPYASQDPQMLFRASPALQVTYMDTPPFFIVHGTYDQVVPGRQSDVLAANLANHGFSPQNYRVGDNSVGLNHGFYPWDDSRTLSIQNASPYNMNLSYGQVHDLLQPSSCALVDFLRDNFGR